jgi:hypothetical protein
MKSKHGYQSYSNGFSTWHYLDQDAALFDTAKQISDFDSMDSLCVLKTDHKTNLSRSKVWPNITTPDGIKAELVRMKQRSER